MGIENKIEDTAPKFFNKLGFIYLAGSLLTLIIQVMAEVIIGRINPEILRSMNGKLLGLMIPTYVVAYPLFLFLISRLPKGEEIEKHKMSFKMLIVSFCMAYALMYASNLVGTVLSIPKIFIDKGNSINPVADVVIESNPWVQLFIMALIAPIFEELIFRKFLIDRVNRFGEGVAIFVSAFVFALFHGNISQGVYAFVLGLFFAFVYTRTGRIQYSMILHILINLMGSVISGGILKLLDISLFSNVMMMEDMSILLEYISSHLVGLTAYVLYVILIQGIIVTGVVMLIVKRKQFKLKEIGTPIPKGKRFKAIMLNVGMIAFTVLYIGMIVFSYITD